MSAVSRWFRSYGFAEVLDEFLIGAYPTDERDVGMLARLGIKRVLNLVEDEEYKPGRRQAVERALSETGIVESRIPLTDYGGLPPEELEQAVTTVSGWLDAGERTYLHCRAGWQRSAAIAAGVVAIRRHLDIEDALLFVQRAKPSANPLDHQREDLRRWWESRNHS
jgi:protein-tyrosine phosphatase